MLCKTEHNFFVFIKVIKFKKNISFNWMLVVVKRNTILKFCKFCPKFKNKQINKQTNTQKSQMDAIYVILKYFGVNIFQKKKKNQL